MRRAFSNSSLSGLRFFDAVSLRAAFVRRLFARRLPVLAGALLVAMLSSSGARADDCRADGEYEFEADTEIGHIIRGQGIVVKLKAEQCGFAALWLTDEAIKNGGEKCKFGGTWSVSGSESKSVPAGAPFSGKMLVVASVECE